MLTLELNRPLQALKSLIGPALPSKAGIDIALKHRLAAIDTAFAGVMETCMDRLRQTSSTTLEPTEVELRKLIKGIANHFQQKTALHLIRCDLKALPDPFRCDPNLIGILISNLVENAIHHSPAGGAIWVSGHANNRKSIEITVTDEGPGIPEAQQERIFDRYFQAHPTESGSVGMGLGLFIVRRIAVMHGGSVVCDSEPGEGATFRVTLTRCDQTQLPA